MKESFSSSNNDNNVNATYCVAAAIQTANDLWIEYSSTTLARECPYKADKLLANDNFQKIFKTQKNFFFSNNVNFDTFNNKVCSIADELKPYADNIKNAFLSELVTKFKFDHCNPLALSLTTSALLKCAAELSKIAFGKTSPLIAKTAYHVQAFGKKVKVSALQQDNIDINFNTIQPHLSKYLNKLYEKTKNNNVSPL